MKSTVAKEKKVGKSPGPKAETLKIDGSWKKAIQKSLAKTKPSAGWPK
jgi:hypothetical protein